MSSLVLELQRDAMNSGSGISDLLRKALVVARKLGVGDFQTWIHCELDGYSDGNEIPEYRRLSGEIKAWNPYNGWIPALIQDVRLAEMLSQRRVGQAIGELESVMSSAGAGATLHIYYPPDIEKRLMEGSELPLRPALHIATSQIDRIFEAVRNAILEWALKLEEDGILGTGMSFSQDEKSQAKRSSSSIFIENFQGILGDVEHSTVSQNLTLGVKQGDFHSLADYLASIGVSRPDLSELENATRAEPTPVDSHSYGPRVSAWIGSMIAKAASGSWRMAAATGADLLARAIAAYYGIGLSQ